MQDENVAIRLKGFIDFKGLSHSQFADTCGIPRPSLSQILSGRNKKVSDVIVGQIHRAFPDLSILWLLFGEGDMLISPPASAQAVADEAFDLSFNGPDFPNTADSSRFGSLFADDEFGADANVGSQNRPTPAAGQNRQISGRETQEFPSNPPQNIAGQNLTALNARLEALKVAEKQLVEYENKIAELQSQIDKMRLHPRSVKQITVYYDDSTFETFYPDANSR